MHLSGQGVSRDLSHSTRTETEAEESKSYDKATRSDEMIHIPAMFLRVPVLWDGFRSPLGNPVVDRYRSNERKNDGEDLDSESNCCETPSGLI